MIGLTKNSTSKTKKIFIMFCLDQRLTTGPSGWARWDKTITILSLMEFKMYDLRNQMTWVRFKSQESLVLVRNLIKIKEKVFQNFLFIIASFHFLSLDKDLELFQTRINHQEWIIFMIRNLFLRKMFKRIKDIWTKAITAAQV